MRLLFHSATSGFSSQSQLTDQGGCWSSSLAVRIPGNEKEGGGRCEGSVPLPLKET